MCPPDRTRDDRSERSADHSAGQTHLEREITRRDVVLAGYEGDIGEIRSGLESPDPSTRAAALGAACRAGFRPLATVCRGVGDPEPEVRRRAAELLATVTEPGSSDSDLSAERALSDLLADPVDDVVERACFAAGELRTTDPAIVARIVEIAGGHDDKLCRESAVAGLGSIGAEAGLDAVLAATDDIAPIRRRATIALAAFDGPRVTEALGRLVDDRDLQVRQIAEDLVSIAEGGDAPDRTDQDS